MIDHKNKIASREIIVTDQGNGGAYCDNCQASQDVGEFYPDNCPGCGYKIIAGSVYINRGGSEY